MTTIDSGVKIVTDRGGGDGHVEFRSEMGDATTLYKIYSILLYI